LEEKRKAREGRTSKEEKKSRREFFTLSPSPHPLIPLSPHPLISLIWVNSAIAGIPHKLPPQGWL
jgi:hypothetical protein